MSRAARTTRPDLAALAFVWAVALAATWQTTLGDRALLPTDLYLRMQPWRAHAREFETPEQVSNPILDAVQQFYPWRLHASRAVRQGTVPLWTTQMLSGAPFVANNQSAVFYPETWLHYVIRPLKALGWATLMFLVVAGSGMYAFLRVIGLRPLPSAIGGVSFMLSGYFVGWLTFPSFRSVGAWLPLMLLGFEQAVRTRRTSWLGLTALGTGMQFLAGNLHISIYVLMGFALYVLARLSGLALDHAGGRRIAGLAALAIAALVVGGLLAGCQLGPSLEFARLNYRTQGLSYPAQVAHALAPPQVLLGIMPDIFGNPADANHWGADLNVWWGKAYRTYTESAWYFGVAPLLLGIAGLGLRPRRQAWFWLGMLGLALALAFGTPLNAILYYLVPGYQQLSGIARVVVLACTAGAVLAALGLDAIMRAIADGRDAIRPVAIAGGALLLIGLVGGIAVWIFTGALEAAGLPGIGGYAMAQIGRFVALLVAAWALIAWGARSRSRWAWWALAVLVALDMGVFMQSFTPEGRTEYPDVEPELVEAIDTSEPDLRIAGIGPDFLDRVCPNTHMIFGLQSLQGSESLIFAPYHRLLTAAHSERYGLEQVDPAHPLLDLMAVRWLASTVDLDEPGWRLAGTYETHLYENEQAAPRAFLAREIVPEPDDDAVFAAITAEGADPMAAHIPGTLAEVPPHDSKVRITDYSANSARIEGEMPAGSWLVLADTAYPGWRAFADGVERPVVRADLVRRAVHLAQGARAVRFVYLPGSFAAGMFATLVALAALSALGASVVLGEAMVMSPRAARAIEAAVVFIIVLVILAGTASNYGLGYDEPIYLTRAQNALSWFRLLALDPGDALSDEGILRFWYPEGEWKPGFMKMWGALTLPMMDGRLPVLGALRFGAPLITAIMCVSIYLFVASVWGRTEAVASLGALMMLPRSFTHMHLFAMDAPVMALMFICLHMFYLAARDRSWGWAAGAGAMWGLAMGAKVNGLFIALIVIPWLALCARDVLLPAIACSAVLGPAAFYAIWPWLWHDPIGRMWRYIDLHVNVWQIDVTYFGHKYRTAPWHYPVVMTLITTPALTLVEAVVGVARVIRERAQCPAITGWRERWTDPAWRRRAAAALIGWGLLAQYVMSSLPNTPKYTGVRLFQPVFPLLAIFAGLGIAWVARLALARVRAAVGETSASLPKIALATVIAVALLPQARAVMAFHPYGMSYYNELIGGLPGAERAGMEVTHWGETYLWAAGWLNRNAPQGALAWIEPPGVESMMDVYRHLGILHTDIRTTAGPFVPAEADYAVFQNKTTEFTDVSRELLRTRTPVATVEQDGVPLLFIFDVSADGEIR